MVKLPDFLKNYREAAEKLLLENRLGTVAFSGGTYQIQIHDPSIPEEEAWVFLQLDSRGQIKDYFCSCSEGQENCVHVATAFLKLYNGSTLPLHQRFEASLWNHLFRLYAERYGDNPHQFQNATEGEFLRTGLNNETLVHIKAKTEHAKEKLEELLFHRIPQTEETSLKFSNLSPEELSNWRRGNPSMQLKYELSFWNDLAHWLMFLQEGKIPYQIDFEFGENSLPNFIHISFSELEVGFRLAENDLPEIIPCLSTVVSPLIVHDYAANQQQLIYDIKAGTITVETLAPQQELKRTKDGITIDRWLFVTGDGFYRTETNQFFGKNQFETEEIGQLLNSHFFEVKPLLKNVTLHSTPIKLSYFLAFDKGWNLHIEAFLFKKGDLTAKDAKYFGNWVYIPDGGFYPITDDFFGGIKLIVAEDDIEMFINERRGWLSDQEGFEIHLSSIESQLTYTLTPDSSLSFSRMTQSLSDGAVTKEFGNWTYCVGKGFFAKVSTPTTLPINADFAIQASQIPVFIRRNRSELESVEGFFSHHCPIAEAKLSIQTTPRDAIQLTPHYIPNVSHLNKNIRFFEEFTYVENEGFYEIPRNIRLPVNYQHVVEIEPEKTTHFIEHELKNLEGFIGEIDPALQPPKTVHLEAQDIDVKEFEYDLKIGYRTDTGFIPLSVFWWALRQKKRYLFNKFGLIDLAEARFDWIRHLQKHQLDKRTNILKCSPLELIKLQALEGIQTEDAGVQKVLSEYTEFKIPADPDLSGLTSHLRHYQNLGVNWLWFLYKHRLSGLLCDEMGLGKTHQAMALLAAVYNDYKNNYPEKKPPHSLVICPTSVIYHWEEKLKEYLPDLRISTFHGSDRSMVEFHQQYDLLLTSYGIWRREYKLLAAIPFEVAIFDEIQIAKNQHSRTHLSLRAVQAKMKIGLTGTPIENNLRELKSLFDLIVPSYMPKENDFRKLFILPIERERKPEARTLLKRFINPFILRRKKIDVLPDLPSKVEELAHCELLPDQKDFYMQALYRSKTHLLAQLEELDMPLPYIHVFSLLSTLKQICNHPAAYLKKPQDYKKYGSGKWDLFIELLNEARESQQKVVVFSQYLAMLDIFSAYLTEMGIGFASIRGATIDRGEQIKRFNQDPKCEVFLGSLHAAGLGIDLTAGSVVIHYDRWWNAAREDQATDRVHRIGQTNPFVQVFKLVTRGTFEERINQLITEKAHLMEEIVSIDDHRFLKQFTRDELLQLLEDVTE